MIRGTLSEGMSFYEFIRGVILKATGKKAERIKNISKNPFFLIINNINFKVAQRRKDFVLEPLILIQLFRKGFFKSEPSRKNHKLTQRTIRPDPLPFCVKVHATITQIVLPTFPALRTVFKISFLICLRCVLIF